MVLKRVLKYKKYVFPLGLLLFAAWLFIPNCRVFDGEEWKNYFLFQRFYEFFIFFFPGLLLFLGIHFIKNYKIRRVLIVATIVQWGCIMLLSIFSIVLMAQDYVPLIGVLVPFILVPFVLLHALLNWKRKN